MDRVWMMRGMGVYYLRFFTVYRGEWRGEEEGMSIVE